MKIIKGSSGILKKTYNFKCSLCKFHSKTFLCKRVIKLDEDTIFRAIKSPKYLVKEIKQGKDFEDLSFKFASDNGFKMDSFQLSQSIDTCGIYAYKNVVNGKEVVEMCLIKTYKDKNSASVSLYYLPNGEIRDATFVARVCKHDLIEHINNDGTKIKAGDIHLHFVNAKQFDEIYHLYKARGEKVLLEKLQSPKAVVHRGLKEEDMQEYSRKFFHITDKTLYLSSNVNQKDGYYIENGKINKGVSSKTLVDEMISTM